jgi:hypothetical protein
MNTEFLNLAPYLEYLPSANQFIRNNKLGRLGQGMIILKIELHFDILYGAT